MKQDSGLQASAEQHIKTIRPATQRKHSTEEKIRSVHFSGLHGESSVAELCRCEGVHHELPNHFNSRRHSAVQLGKAHKVTGETHYLKVISSNLIPATKNQKLHQ